MRYWIEGTRHGEPFLYDTGSHDLDWAEAVLTDVSKWPGVTDAKIVER